MESIDVLIVTDNNLETIGGEQESTKIILENLKDEFSLAVFQPGPLKQKPKNILIFSSTDKTRVKFIVKNPYIFIKHLYSLYENIKKINPKIIHTQAQVSFFLVAFLRKVKLIDENIKIIHTERGLYRKYSNFIITVFLFFINELDTLVTTTEYNYKDWKKAIEERNIEIQYSIISNTAGELFETYDRTKDKKNNDTFVIGFSGRYTDWKNWPLALDIINEIDYLIEDKLEVRMAVGTLDKKAEVETKKMFDNVQKKLGNRFVGMMNITLEEMNEFYYELDLFILTSKPNTESFGRTLVEAMSRKTAVLTTNAGGAEEVVRNKNNVCATLEEMLTRIMEFITLPNELNKEKINNLKIVKENYSLANNVTKHSKLYKKH